MLSVGLRCNSGAAGGMEEHVGSRAAAVHLPQPWRAMERVRTIPLSRCVQGWLPALRTACVLAPETASLAAKWPTIMVSWLPITRLPADPPTMHDPVQDTFCLVCLAVEEVDHIELKGNIRHQYLLKAAGEAATGGEGEGGGQAAAEWSVQRLNP
jgi:hypothetical protein